MATFEIRFEDLNQEAQEAFLKFANIKSPEEGNYDVFPIAEIDNGEED